jgi:hypothetical protein
VVLMEMLTGRRLYSGATAAETLAAVILKDPTFDALPAATPASIRKLIRRCLDKEPRRRLRDIGEARIALEEGDAAEPAPATAQRGLLPWIVAAASLACALALAFLHFREAPAPERILRYSIQSPEKTRIHSFAITPDGHYLAMSAASEGKRRLWVQSLDTVKPHSLSGTDEASNPFWSPDSRSIGFFAEGKLKRVALEGGPALTLCDAENGTFGTWSREGVVLFDSFSERALRRRP